MFTRLFKKRNSAAAPVRQTYELIVAAARHPVLYAGWGVPDTVDGRFDMVALHVFLVVEHLKDREFAQDITDEFFRDMDRSLREMGAGDVSVPKKVRRMAEAYMGRAAAYRQAFAEAGQGPLEATLQHNVFAGAKGDIAALAAYARRQHAHLAGAAPGAIAFLEPDT